MLSSSPRRRHFHRPAFMAPFIQRAISFHFALRHRGRPAWSRPRQDTAQLPPLGLRPHWTATVASPPSGGRGNATQCARGVARHVKCRATAPSSTTAPLGTPPRHAGRSATATGKTPE